MALGKVALTEKVICLYKGRAGNKKKKEMMANFKMIFFGLVSEESDTFRLQLNENKKAIFWKSPSKKEQNKTFYKRWKLTIHNYDS